MRRALATMQCSKPRRRCSAVSGRRRSPTPCPLRRPRTRTCGGGTKATAEPASEAGALASNGQGPPSITERLRSAADGAQAAADLIGAGAAGLAAAQAFRSQLPHNAAALPRQGQPSDVERFLDGTARRRWSVAQRKLLRRRRRPERSPRPRRPARCCCCARCRPPPCCVCSSPSGHAASMRSSARCPAKPSGTSRAPRTAGRTALRRSSPPQSPSPAALFSRAQRRRRGKKPLTSPPAASTPTSKASLWHACASKTRGGQLGAPGVLLHDAGPRGSPGWWAARSPSASSRCDSRRAQRPAAPEQTCRPARPGSSASPPRGHLSFRLQQLQEDLARQAGQALAPAPHTLRSTSCSSGSSRILVPRLTSASGCSTAARPCQGRCR